jgi:hypothetical protein
LKPLDAKDFIQKIKLYSIKLISPRRDWGFMPRVEVFTSINMLAPNNGDGKWEMRGGKLK